jgi:hypothetical protein
MHANRIVQRFFDEHLLAMHAARRRVLAVLVWAAMLGSALSLSRLARSLSGHSCSMKTSLKRVDRYVGHERAGMEGEQVARALLACLCRWMSPLVIAVDWSAASPGGTFVELRAAVVWAGMGRGLSVYQRVYPSSKNGNRKAEAALLKSLADWIPKGTRVIVVTDAGFHTPWFKAVAKRGWGWVGRVRAGNHLRRGEGPWQDALAWGRRAKPKAQRLTDCQLVESARLACDLVLVRRAVVGGPRYRRPGHGSTPKAAADARRSAREPWVLAHSTTLRDLRADEIVALYARRMQIEENFRDTKSLAFGMGAEIGRSRSAARLQALLLIGNLAAFLLWHIGQIAEVEGLHRRFMATTRKTRELSLLTLAMLLCERHVIPLSRPGVAALRRRLEIKL